jgi:hypothetical protein
MSLEFTIAAVECPGCRKQMVKALRQTRWTLVLTARRSRTEPLVATKMIRFATKALAEAELAKAKDRGEPAYLLPPIEAWGGKDPRGDA